MQKFDLITILLEGTIAILLPIAPSLALYRLLPEGNNGAAAQGKKFGIQFKIAGPILCYLLIFSAVGYFFWWMTIYYTDVNRREIWKIQGTIKVTESINAENTRLLLFPKNYSVHPNGDFEISIPLKRGAENTEIPMIAIDIDGYKPTLIRPSQIEVESEAKRRMKIDSPIDLQRKPNTPYQPQGSPLQKKEGV